MTKMGHNFPPPDDLPIPEDAKPGLGWTEQMLEMADHIGAYRTLLFVDRFGGMRVYIPAFSNRGKSYKGKGTIREAIGDEAAAILSRVYRREYLIVPTAKSALTRARRAALIASARARDIPIAEAARVLRTSRPYLSHLVHHTKEGVEGGPEPRRGRASMPGQMHLFGDEDDA